MNPQRLLLEYHFCIYFLNGSFICFNKWWSRYSRVGGCYPFICYCCFFIHRFDAIRGWVQAASCRRIGRWSFGAPPNNYWQKSCGRPICLPFAVKQPRTRQCAVRHDAIAEQYCDANRTNKHYWHSKTKFKIDFLKLFSATVLFVFGFRISKLREVKSCRAKELF